MSAIVIPISVQPNRGDPGLSTLLRRFSTDASAEDALADAPSRWTADPSHAGMFLKDVIPVESGPKACEIDYLYQGSFGTLPAVRSRQGMSLRTANYTDGGPIQLEIVYRSPSTTHTWIGTDDSVAYSGYTGALDPVIERRKIRGFPFSVNYVDFVRQSVEYGVMTDDQRTRTDAWLAANASAIDALRTTFLSIFDRAFTSVDRLTDFTADEIVPGQFWQCAATTSRIYESEHE
jgi:hypothetical protein